MYEDYGNLAGFMGFAGAADTSSTPVVRYQDLHRSRTTSRYSISESVTVSGVSSGPLVR